jgi:hypothetical protein
MKVAILCEYSGIVRDAFLKEGHNAISHDLLLTESEGPHVKCNIQELERDYWKQFDMAICHPPCTHLAVSGARWFKYKQNEQVEALEFVRYLLDLPIKRICIENPVSIISSEIRPPDQCIQPWQFGHGETKKTCLWLKGLPPLIPTDIVEGREQRIHNMPPGPDRGKERSRFYPGIADAMAKQWGTFKSVMDY